MILFILNMDFLLLIIFVNLLLLLQALSKQMSFVVNKMFHEFFLRTSAS